MVILERTPPRKWQESEEEVGEVFAGQNESVKRLNENNALPIASSSSAQPRKSYVFPSLEDMAAPIREQRAALQGNSQQPASPSASAASPSTSKQLPPSSTTNRQLSPTQKIQSSKIPIHRNTRVSTSPQKKSISPMALKKSVGESSATKQAGMNKALSPSKNVASLREAAVDAAFQEQIERAIASGENPFMDKRRAAMRDDSNASIVSTTPTSLYPALPPKRSSISRQSESRLQTTAEGSSRGNATTERQLEIQQNDDGQSRTQLPRRSQEEVQRAVATVQESLMSEYGQRAADDEKIDQKTNNAGPQDVQPPSTPLEVFTPQRRRLTKEAHAVPIIQQEELHRLRSELRECKALLRDSQLETEQLQQDCQDNKAQYDDEKRKNQTIEAQLQHLESIALDHECKLKETQWQLSQDMLRDAMERDEQMRKKEIEIVLAKNKITRLRARALNAESNASKLEGKKGRHDEEVQQEITELKEIVERLRSERDGLKAHVKDLEKQCKEFQQQADSHADQLEALENAVATEKSRRKEISTREANLIGEVQELQKVAAREAKLRTELAEIKADLSNERDIVRDLRKQSQQRKQIRSSISPSRTSAVSSSVHAGSRKDSRNAMMQEAESSFDRSLEARALSPPPLKGKGSTVKQHQPKPLQSKEVKQPKLTKTTSKTKQKPISEDEESQDEFEKTQSPVRKPKVTSSRSKTQPLSRAKAKEKEIDLVIEEEDIESDPELPAEEQMTASPVREKRKVAIEKNPTIAKKTVRAIEKEEEPTEVPQQDQVQSFLPTMKMTKKSILNKGRVAPPKLKTMAVDSSSRSQIPSEMDDSSGTSKSNKSKDAAVAPDSSHDETMKTPLLPSKRTRAMQNRQMEQDAEDKQEVDVRSAKQKATEKVKAVPSENIGNVSYNGVEKTPMVQKNTTAEPRKKKRKLLKPGANIAGDFLNWKGDADGALNPGLNLPMELSPLKQGEEVRSGNGLSITTGGAQKVFGRRK